MYHWIKNLLKIPSAPKSAFERTFSYLENFNPFTENKINPVYELLRAFNESSSKEAANELVEAVKSIRFHSNTNGFFNFYFPIVSHVLFYKPEYENELLGLIIGPNFANGTTDVPSMMTLIPGAMEFGLKKNPNYLTTEGQFWIKNTFPNLEKEVEREIARCREETA